MRTRRRVAGNCGLWRAKLVARLPGIYRLGVTIILMADRAHSHALARNVTMLRTRNGLTRNALATMCGVALSTVRAMETGGYSSIPSICRVADFFRVTVTSLLNEGGERAIALQLVAEVEMLSLEAREVFLEELLRRIERRAKP